MTRPILLNACADAATAKELAYRIDTHILPARPTRVVAIDPGANDVVRDVCERGTYAHTKFFTNLPGDGALAAGNMTANDDLELNSIDGHTTRLGDELEDAAVVVMVATNDEGAQIASRVGESAWMRGIMTAGLILSDGNEVPDALRALRPHARVLMVPADESDLAELLTAIRA